MKHVLIVTQSFPPWNDIASRRFGLLAPLMEAQGWHASVLTTHGDGPLPVGLPESQVFRLTPHPDSQVGKTREKRDGRSFVGKARSGVRSLVRGAGFRLNTLYPANLRWYRAAVRERDLVSVQWPRPDVVIGTFAPTAALLIARDFARRWQCPWVADFRDLGAFRPDKANRVSRLIDRCVERSILRSAAAGTTVSRTLAAILHREYGLNTEVIYNGWEPPAGGSIERQDEPGPHASGPLPAAPYLYYAGLLYEHRMDAVLMLLDALVPHHSVHLVLRSLGPESLERQVQSAASERGLLSRLHILPRCDPETVDSEAAGALANVVFEDLSQAEEAGRGTLTGKFLKLLPLTPAILAIARPDSEMGPILAETGRGSLCSATAEIVKFLHAITTLPRHVSADLDSVRGYSMVVQAEKLSRFLDQVVGAAASEASPRRIGRRPILAGAQRPNPSAGTPAPLFLDSCESRR